MEIIIGILFAAAVLTGIALIARRFLKPVKGPLPDCCSKEGNKNVRI
jgi:hypothetical protein